MSNDVVDHPSHYNYGSIECIDVIKEVLGDSFVDYEIGNVIKYIFRHKHKNGLEDLKKAQWYLNDAIKQIEKQESEGKLKPCPFCGGKAELIYSETGMEDRVCCIVKCSDWQCIGSGMNIWQVNDIEAIEKWNSRS